MKSGIALLALLLTVPGIPVQAQAQKEIVVWHGYRGGEKAAFEKVVNQFNQSQKGV
jgi:ABC-type glycerol-3-phosphate transport system substrate-binding protein